MSHSRSASPPSFSLSPSPLPPHQHSLGWPGGSAADQRRRAGSVAARRGAGIRRRTSCGKAARVPSRRRAGGSRAVRRVPRRGEAGTQSRHFYNCYITATGAREDAPARHVAVPRTCAPYALTTLKARQAQLGRRFLGRAQSAQVQGAVQSALSTHVQRAKSTRQWTTARTWSRHGTHHGTHLAYVLVENGAPDHGARHPSAACGSHGCPRSHSMPFLFPTFSSSI